MKRILLAFSGLLLAATSFGQACTPDPQYANTGVPGVYPQDTTSDTTVIAICIGEPFSFTFTAVVPNAFNGIPLQTINITGITGFPSGDFVYSCYSPDANGQNNTDCIFHGAATANDPALIGCLIVTAPASATSGLADGTVYPLNIAASINGFLNTTIPGPLLAYAFHLQAQNCTGINETAANPFRVGHVMPNPVAAFANVYVYAPRTMENHTVTITNAFGQVVEVRNAPLMAGNNLLSIDASTLANGVYTISFGDGAELVSKKIIVAH
jgi:hypothetical protein